MAGKLDGSKAIQSGTITTTQLATVLNDTISAGGGPKIQSLIYPGDDTAANTIGGQTIYITGSGFDSNVAVYVNNAAVPSVTYISASNVGFTTPALSAATYPVYVTNPDDGATAILIPGMLVSGEPSWVTGATLSEQDASSAWNISLSATGDAPLTYALAAGSSLPSGISLASNGTISGTITTPPETDTTYNFTVVATDAQNQDSSRAFSVTASTGEGVLFANNVLLLHADGTNNGNNHSFLDSSNNNFTITRNGNATQGSYSPFSQTGWSGYFDGTGDYLSIADNAALDMGSSNFTIEGWYFPIGNASSSTAILAKRANSGTVGGVLLYYGGNGLTPSLLVDIGGSWAINQSSSVAFVANQWNHFAIVRNGSAFNLYINGVSGVSATNAGTIPDNASAFTIGAMGADGSGAISPCHISNFRVVKGTAVYTSAFTPPSAPLALIANTSLLTCQDNNFIDEGPNNFAITRNGDVSVQAFSPFAPGLLSSNSHSVYFDGTGDYLNASNATAFNLSTGDWTIECWINLSALTAEARIWSLGTYASNPEVALLIGGGGAGGSSNDLQLNYVGNSTLITASSVNSIGAWAHVAVVRSSGTTTLYVNGVSKGTTTTNPWTSSSTSLWIGGWSQNNNQMTGSISNFRVVKGTAVYTSNFTPSTSPLTAVSNTSLLACQSATLIDNSTNAFTITAYGNVQPRTYNPFGQTYTSTAYSTANVGGSAYFDGTGDYLSYGVGNTSIVNWYSQSTTIEAWIYPTAYTTFTNGYGATFTNGDINTNTNYWGFGINSNKLRFIYFGSGGTNSVESTGTVLLNAWTHIAFVYNHGDASIKLFINGVLDGSGTKVGTPQSDANIGIKTGGWYGGYFSGYMSGVRMLQGTALYTASFAPPTAPLTNVANTRVLLSATNAQIFDQTGKNVLECVGDAKVSTAQYKYGSASIAFDGTGDYLKMPSSPIHYFGTGSWTIEFWVKSSMTTRCDIIGYDYSYTIGTWAGLIFNVSGNNQMSWYEGSNQRIHGTSVSWNNNNWHHVAISRNGNSLKMFLDGTQVGSTYTTSYTYGNASSGWYIGTSTDGNVLNGYIDDLRITKGYARYTANFTAPTAKFKDK